MNRNDICRGAAKRFLGLLAYFQHSAAVLVDGNDRRLTQRNAAAGNEKGLAQTMYFGWLLYSAAFALAAFLSVYALQNSIASFVAAFPVWLVHGFEVAGGLMPAVGLALLLVVMLKKENVAYLLAGFVIMIITNCQNILPVAIIAGCIAFIGFNRDVEMNKAAAAAPAVQEGDFEDGI